MDVNALTSPALAVGESIILPSFLPSTLSSTKGCLCHTKCSLDLVFFVGSFAFPICFSEKNLSILDIQWLWWVKSPLGIIKDKSTLNCGQFSTEIDFFLLFPIKILSSGIQLQKLHFLLVDVRKLVLQSVSGPQKTQMHLAGSSQVKDSRTSEMVQFG